MGEIADYLHALVERLNSTPEPDPEMIARIGVGELENLLRDDEMELWPEIESIARRDPRFRSALASAWAYDSPAFEQREQLLRELGEAAEVTIKFVVKPEGFDDPPRLGWRAVEIDGEPPAGQLARLLGEIADWYERDRADRESGIAWRVHEPYFAWAEATQALQRAWHRVGIASNYKSLRAAMKAVDQSRDEERRLFEEFFEAFLNDEGSGP